MKQRIKFEIIFFKNIEFRKKNKQKPTGVHLGAIKKPLFLIRYNEFGMMNLICENDFIKIRCKEFKPNKIVIKDARHTQ